MQAKNDISEELRSLSVLVHGIGRQMPYELPKGYFEDLAPSILALIQGQILNGIEKGTGINNGADNDEPVGLSKSLAFTVPEGYFDNFASQLLDRIKAGSAGQKGDEFGASLALAESVQEELVRLSPVVSGISRETPYRLPEGYFAEVSPILSVLRDKMTYQAPQGYFDYLPAATMERAASTVAKAAGKVISIGSRGKVIKGHWWKYSAVAAAACLILVFSWPQLHTGFTKINEGKTDVGPRLASVDLAQNLSQGLHKVSDQEILNYLDDQNSILAEPVSNNTATLDMNDSDVKTLLGDVPDGELQQYMEEHGRANDIATN